jgi:Txe/YoeB family toxin of Txe-Axe toxin-antitoxin module
MKVMMTDFARQQVRKTARYINSKFGKTSKDNFLLKVKQTKLFLETNPCLGPIEPLLSDRAMIYRSIVVNHLNKMVYRVLDDYIEIVDFWDTRREPKKQAEQVK